MQTDIIQSMLTFYKEKNVSQIVCSCSTTLWPWDSWLQVWKLNSNELMGSPGANSFGSWWEMKRPLVSWSIRKGSTLRSDTMGEASQGERKSTPGQQDSGSCSVLVIDIKIHLYLLDILRNQVFPTIQRRDAEDKRPSYFAIYLHFLYKEIQRGSHSLAGGLNDPRKSLCWWFQSQFSDYKRKGNLSTLCHALYWVLYMHILIYFSQKNKTGKLSPSCR